MTPAPRVGFDLSAQEAADALMIGDNVEADLVPARALGLRTFQVDALAPGRSIGDALRVACPSRGPS